MDTKLKSLISVVVLLLVAMCGWAQTTPTPQPKKGINYQAVLKNAAGTILQNKNVALRFTLLKGSTGVYVETHTTTTNANGFVSVVIGSGSNPVGNFGKIEWSGQTVQVKIELDENGGTTFTTLGTTTLTAIPYAYEADHTVKADSAAFAKKVELKLALEGNKLKLTNANDLTLPFSRIIYVENEAAFNNTAKVPGLQIFVVSENCLYIYEDEVYFRKLCNFGCGPTPTIPNAGADISTNQTTFVLNGNTPTVGTGSWSIVTGTGGSIASDGKTFTGVAGNTYTVRYTIGNRCGSLTDDITVALTGGETVADFEGNEYRVAQVGTQFWIIDNLKSTKYADGAVINGIYPPNGNDANVATHGYLYTGAAALRGTATGAAGVQGVCPNGFHIPTQAEIVTIDNYFAGVSTNETLFKADEPAGQRGEAGAYYGFGNFGSVWTTQPTGDMANIIWYGVAGEKPSFTIFMGPPLQAQSVRCIKN